MTFEWTDLVGLAGALLSLIAGIGAVPIIYFLKRQLSFLSGRWAQLATVIVAVVLAVLTGIVEGRITPTQLTAEHLLELFTIVLLASQAEYARLKRLESEQGG